MMRITETSSTGEVRRLRLEGRLTRRTAANLRAIVEQDLRRRGTVVLDLSAVSFADSDGVEALQDLKRRGTTLLGCSGFLAELLHSKAVVAGVSPSDDGGEAALVERLRRGEEAAFAELVSAQGGRLLAVARRLLGSEEEARDAVQDAFLSAFRSISSFGGGARLSTWLHRIVVNAALMRLRRRRRKREEPIDELLPTFAADGHWSQEPKPWGASADELLAARDVRAAVRRCIDRLPESHRTVLLLRDIEDLDTDETAELLGITAGAVKVRLHRARQALRTLLEREVVAGEAPKPGAGAAVVSVL
jgi:RNA polymerase sigma-70 factor (ECF subfamily)